MALSHRQGELSEEAQNGGGTAGTAVLLAGLAACGGARPNIMQPGQTVNGYAFFGVPTRRRCYWSSATV
jgi:hypothetical protein